MKILLHPVAVFLQCRERGKTAACMGIHEIGILRCCLQYGFRCLLGVFSHGGETVGPIFVHTGGNAGDIRSGIADNVAGQHGNPAVSVELAAQFGMGRR